MFFKVEVAENIEFACLCNNVSEWVMDGGPEIRVASGVGDVPFEIGQCCSQRCAVLVSESVRMQ